jgi:hypothetical protein
VHMDEQYVTAGGRPQGHLAALVAGPVTGVQRAAWHHATPSGWQRDISASTGEDLAAGEQEAH